MGADLQVESGLARQAGERAVACIASHTWMFQYIMANGAGCHTQQERIGLHRCGYHQFPFRQHDFLHWPYLLSLLEGHAECLSLPLGRPGGRRERSEWRFRKIVIGQHVCCFGYQCPACRYEGFYFYQQCPVQPFRPPDISR